MLFLVCRFLGTFVNFCRMLNIAPFALLVAVFLRISVLSHASMIIEMLRILLIWNSDEWSHTVTPQGNQCLS